MSSVASEADIEAVKDLLARSSLKAVEYHELSARWTGSREGSESDEANVELSLERRLDGGTFGFRMTGDVTTDYGEVRSVVAATYEYEGELPDLRGLLAFGNEVAIMTLFPYFRESISSITSRVFGDSILLPVFNLDEVQVEV
jgi:hypothetical protein